MKTYYCLAVAFAASASAGRYRGGRYSASKPRAKQPWELDRYNWSQQGKNSWTSFYQTLSEGDLYKLSNHSEDETEDNIIDILETRHDPTLTTVVLDVRTDAEVSQTNMDVTDLETMTYLDDDFEFNARYSRFNYDAVKTDPKLLIRTVADLYYGEGAYTTEKNIGENFEDNWTIQSEELMDVDLVIFCGQAWCGNQYAAAKWHGFKNVRYVNNLNYFLQNMVEKRDQELIKKDNIDDEGGSDDDDQDHGGDDDDDYLSDEETGYYDALSDEELDSFVADLELDL